jgi:hypothetical protein
MFKKIQEFLKNGHIVMGYLPNGKIRGFFKSGHIVMGYLPRMKNTRIFQKWSHCNGLPAQWIKKYENFSKVVTL